LKSGLIRGVVFDERGHIRRELLFLKNKKKTLMKKY
jgi:hypothetical protein